VCSSDLSNISNTVSVPENLKSIFDIAEKKVGDYFSHLKLSPEKGSIKINNERYVLVRASALSHEFLYTISNLYKDRGEEEALNIGKNILLDIGHVIGMEDAKVLHKKMKLKSPIEKLSAGPVHFAHSGWASVKIHPESNPVGDENFYLKYDHPYSFEADAWIKNGIKSKTPVCIMNAAYSSGWCQESFGIPLSAIEITCKAKGDASCTFIMAHPNKIEGLINKEFKSKKIKSKPSIPSFFERKKIEEHLIKNESILSTAQKIAKIGSFDFNVVTNSLSWSEELYHIFEIDSASTNASKLYNEYLSRLPVHAQSEYFKHINLAISKGKDYTFQHSINLPNGKTKWLYCAGLPIKNSKGKVTQIIGIAQDITDRINTEIELNKFFKLSNDLLCLANFDGYFLKLSHGWKKILGYTIQELTSKPFIHFVHPDDVEKTLSELSHLKVGDHVIGFENRYRHKNGTYRILNWNVAPDKKTGLLYCIVRDVSDDRASEQKLKGALQEKEILLKEIHHRVKNNLQIISSLLKLHSEKSNDEKFSDLVGESQNRIISMALIHEMLYANSNLSEINLSGYSKALFEILKKTYNKNHVELILDMPKDFSFQIDQMIPIGLIMNELFSNSFKYAFQNESGNIKINFQKNTLTISDNGIGFKYEHLNNDSSFGLQLVSLLAEQIDADLTINSEKGTQFEFTFKS
jgi:PAS domain S-box-containing protein